MTAPARLLALRLQGFKSFAERTVVEFGPGISAVVGPNGSGKSNLADALRWSLGEQGRALRSRKSEDVIFAGSEKRSALGMADVTLVLDNGDALLPVDFSVLELGRRLYRSGENDYLLNKQRIRLRDLVDLLDAAHLADNAFLFIGQGMVDQALALRPEERRPLFEEVAGVRRHERRRRRSEEQLVESEANLARVEDILAELRPQARRLAAQAEQQATRASAGDELATALLAAAHARWHEAAGLAASAAARVDRERHEADRAMAELQAAEEAASAVAAELSERAATERERQAAHEAARSVVTELRLRDARLAGDLEGIDRDRARLAGDREAAEASLVDQRRALAVPVPARDVDLDSAVAEADRLLAEALAEVASLRAAGQARGEEAAALRRAEAARQAEAETARRRLAEATRRLEAERSIAVVAEGRRAELDESLVRARSVLDDAQRAVETATVGREMARTAADDLDARRRSADERVAAAASAVASATARLASLDARLHEDEELGIARAARRTGGRRLDVDVVIEPALRAAVEATLDELVRAYVVDAASVVGLAGERGYLLVRELVRERTAATAAAPEPATRRFLDRLSEVGGALLSDAIRRDPGGSVARVLARAAVVPELSDAIALQGALPAGWTIATRDGSAVVTDLAVRLGRGDAPLERRAQADRLRGEVERLQAESDSAADEAASARSAADTARVALDAADAAETRAAADRRKAEESERSAARELEAVARELGWQEAQLARLTVDVERAREVAVGLDGSGIRESATDSSAPSSSQPARPDDAAGLVGWEARVAELRARRERLTTDQAGRDADRREAESRRARAEATVAIAEERIARAERDLAALGERSDRVLQDRRALAADLAVASEREERAAAALAETRQADSADRDRLAQAERAAVAARDRLRSADERLRAGDRADLEARLGRDALREQLLVELAGLGELGRRRLEGEAGVLPVAVGPGPSLGRDDEDDPGRAEVESDETAALESALDAAAARWAAEAPAGEPPSPGRLTTLRRRLHELGAANPFAVEEYDELRRRLDALEAQREDLRSAIDKTRRLIAELNVMIATQFRATFTALETAFDTRFQQLFGGGFARLSLTDPEDLSSTGVEIVARPPGKKAQALAMLSGGERALTAVALLFAMLEVRPVPFCVLDEVDAALDEANVGRFSEALRGLAERTQFIVITHNRGTIEAADALYGVTVGDDSVSHVISLRLDEARTIADRQRGQRLAGVDGNGATGGPTGGTPAIDELAEVG